MGNNVKQVLRDLGKVLDRADWEHPSESDSDAAETPMPLRYGDADDDHNRATAHKLFDAARQAGAVPSFISARLALEQIARILDDAGWGKTAPTPGSSESDNQSVEPWKPAAIAAYLGIGLSAAAAIWAVLGG